MSRKPFICMKIAAEYIEAGSAIYLGHIINNLSESGFAGFVDFQDDPVSSEVCLFHLLVRVGGILV
ncbi:MAG TPA: hypothetical protein DCQ58_09350 [Saprospirales bacterium]|nr:hypothetical protein [Saprospirales bacterium]